ncbi:hypothetical protein M2399_002797 [Pseudomonas sp. BIGb0450]|jgi:hypothetical protein|nr:hypothetical protein [Pseudomonas sp. BIGb0558]MCS3437356.1 hypothetical protein [Pseudomonas sp. BIGb0450]
MGFLTSYRLLGFLLLLAVSAAIAWQVQAWRYGTQLE